MTDNSNTRKAQLAQAAIKGGLATKAKMADDPGYYSRIARTRHGNRPASAPVQRYEAIAEKDPEFARRFDEIYDALR